MTPEEELLDELRQEHAGSDISIQESSSSYFTVLQQRFPVFGSKIDWELVPAARIHRLDTADSEAYFEGAETFFEEICDTEGFDRQRQVVIIGDSAMESALTMSLETLAACLRSILAMPQHTYVITADASWCMAFTMEGDLCFGYGGKGDGANV